jgi:drug/metabolite transporter (DMT)-like permease
MPAHPQSPRADRRATAIGLVAVLCWSSTVGLIRSVAEQLGPLGGAAMLYTVSAVLVLQVQGRPTRAELRQSSRWYVWGGAFIFALYEICLSVAIGLAHDREQAIELGMVNYLWPSLTIVLAVVCGQQRARWWLWPGVLLCMIGLVRVMTSGQGAATSDAWWQGLLSHMAANPVAYALAFGAAVLWPVYSLVSRVYARGANAVGYFLALTAVWLWLQWSLVPTPPMQWGVPVVLEVLALGALTALGYGCWEHGLQRGNLAVMAAGSYFTPVFSALLASLWLAVQPGWAFWQGVALVTVGSLVCWWATRQ